MGISRSELSTLKTKLKAEMLRRNGLGASDRLYTPSAAFGSMAPYGGAAYDFVNTPTKDGKIHAEYGQKTVDLLLKIKQYDGLEPTAEGNPIPKGFNSDLITIVDNLAKEKFSGETAATIAKRKAAGENVLGLTPETSSCNGACSGLCVGSCIGQCNGCYNTCTATCGTGCNGGLMVSAR
jgi:hypothetical protein